MTGMRAVAVLACFAGLLPAAAVAQPQDAGKPPPQDAEEPPPRDVAPPAGVAPEEAAPDARPEDEPPTEPEATKPARKPAAETVDPETPEPTEPDAEQPTRPRRPAPRAAPPPRRPPPPRAAPMRAPRVDAYRQEERGRRDVSSRRRPGRRSTGVPGAYRHDGFYLRLGAGFGAYRDSFRSDAEGTREVDAYATGVALTGELALGGTPAPGLVVGGGLYSASVLASDLDAEDAAVVPAELQPVGDNFSLLGPFLDYYFDAVRGLHFQAALGFAWLNGLSQGGGRFDDRYHAFGGGFMLGFGYEWWVAREWSVGVLGRVMGGYAVGDDEADVQWGHAVGTAPSVLLTVTYH